MDDLVKLVKAVASEKADRPKKIERLQVIPGTAAAVVTRAKSGELT